MNVYSVEAAMAWVAQVKSAKRDRKQSRIDFDFLVIVIFPAERLEAAFGSGATNKLTSLVRKL